MTKRRENTTLRQVEVPNPMIDYINQKRDERRANNQNKGSIYEYLDEFLGLGFEAYKAKDEAVEEVQADEVQGVESSHEADNWNEVTRFNSLVNISKFGVERIKDDFMRLVKEGFVSPAELMATISAFEKIFTGDKGLKKQLNPFAVTEVEKSNGHLAVGNFKLSVVEAGVRYDFSNDGKWNDLNADLELAKERLKNRELTLKNVPKPDPIKGIRPMVELDEETGETVELHPPVKTSTTTIRTTFINNQ